MKIYCPHGACELVILVNRYCLDSNRTWSNSPTPRALRLEAGKYLHRMPFSNNAANPQVIYHDETHNYYCFFPLVRELSALEQLARS